MIANHIHDALAQVRELQVKILEKQRFKGYSGRARILSGMIALAAAFLMSAAFFPMTHTAHLIGWGVVFLIGFVINYGALLVCSKHNDHFCQTCVIMDRSTVRGECLCYFLQHFPLFSVH